MTGSGEPKPPGIRSGWDTAPGFCPVELDMRRRLMPCNSCSGLFNSMPLSCAPLGWLGCINGLLFGIFCSIPMLLLGW